MFYDFVFVAVRLHCSVFIIGIEKVQSMAIELLNNSFVWRVLSPLIFHNG